MARRQMKQLTAERSLSFCLCSQFERDSNNMSAYDSAYRAQPAYDLNPFNISGSSRSRSSSLANLHTTNAATIPATSADVHGDIGVLERENFDLKLRLFYLEEKLKHTGTETQVQLVDLEMELQNKNKAIVEKEEEIEGKNVLLVKVG